MVALSQRVQQFKPSPFVRLARRVHELKTGGRPVITLYAGEPDFEPTQNILDEAVAAMKRGEHKYTPPDGTAALRAAISRKFERENGLRYANDEIIVSAGCKQVIMNALLATIDEGDEVVIPTPYWMSYPEMVSLCGGKPVIVRCSENNGFKLDASDVAAAITPRTKWLFINSPNNPCGVVYSEDELRAIAKVMVSHEHVLILSDDIYEHIRFGDGDFKTLASVEPSLASRVLTINGVSKAYAMTGWRIGYGGGPRDLVRAMVAVQSQMSGGPSSISQAAAVEALDGPQDEVPRRSRVFEERSRRVCSALNATPGLRCFEPKGAFYVFCSCAGAIGKVTPSGGHIQTSADLATYLLEEFDVAVMEGEMFGVDNFFRISIAASDATLDEACSRIRRACESLH
jgi:aspartate aminotransferase